MTAAVSELITELVGHETNVGPNGMPSGIRGSR